MVRVTEHLDMTIAVDWDFKPQTNKNPTLGFDHKVKVTYLSNRISIKS